MSLIRYNSSNRSLTFVSGYIRFLFRQIFDFVITRFQQLLKMAGAPSLLDSSICMEEVVAALGHLLMLDSILNIKVFFNSVIYRPRKEGVWLLVDASTSLRIQLQIWSLISITLSSRRIICLSFVYNLCAFFEIYFCNPRQLKCFLCRNTQRRIRNKQLLYELQHMSAISYVTIITKGCVFACLYLGNQFHFILFNKRRLLHQKEVENHTDSPHIYLLGIFNTLPRLWSAPLIKPCQCAHLKHLIFLSEALRNVKICKLNDFVLWVDKNIVGLQISVTHAVAVEIFNYEQQLFENGKDFVFRQVALFADDVVFQSSTFNKLHYHVKF